MPGLVTASSWFYIGQSDNKRNISAHGADMSYDMRRGFVNARKINSVMSFLQNITGPVVFFASWTIKSTVAGETDSSCFFSTMDFSAYYQNRLL